MGFRKKLSRAASRGAAEPTDNPFFGGIVDPGILREIDATNPVVWMHKRPEREGLDTTEANFPEAWAAGRELARAAYARRLREAQPIPRGDEAMRIAGVQSLPLMTWVPLVVHEHVQRGEVRPEDIDTKEALATCLIGYALTLGHLYDDHWKS
jgi:hypothetical protein